MTRTSLWAHFYTPFYNLRVRCASIKTLEVGASIQYLPYLRRTQF